MTTPQRYEIDCQLLLITNRKSHTGFRLVPTSMTLVTFNGVLVLILRFSPNSIALHADYVTIFEDRPIMSVKYCLPVPVFPFWPKLMYPAARSLCDSWACCYFWGFLRLRHIWWKSIKKCHRESAHRRIHRQTDRQTQTDYHLFHAICYSYAAYNNFIVGYKFNVYV